MTVIDDYLEKIEPSKKEQLERIREIAKKVVPDAEDSIAYGMPTLKYNGKSFLGFDTHKEHIGIYPFGGVEITFFKDKLNKLGFTSSKGAIQVPYDKSFPEDLLKDIITQRINRIIG